MPMLWFWHVYWWNPNSCWLQSPIYPFTWGAPPCTVILQLVNIPGQEVSLQWAIPFINGRWYSYGFSPMIHGMILQVQPLHPILCPHDIDVKIQIHWNPHLYCLNHAQLHPNYYFNFHYKSQLLDRARIHLWLSLRSHRTFLGPFRSFSLPALVLPLCSSRVRCPPWKSHGRVEHQRTKWGLGANGC